VAVSVGLVILLALAALAARYLLWPTLARGAARHRRRTHPDPRYRVAGAWQDALWGIGAAGLPVARLTADEITEQATPLLGPVAREPLGQLAALSKAALFSPASPTAADADSAWAAAVQVRKLAWHKATWKARLTALVRSTPRGSSQSGLSITIPPCSVGRGCLSRAGTC
jgi:hypothetical protein